MDNILKKRPEFGLTANSLVETTDGPDRNKLYWATWIRAVRVNFKWHGGVERPFPQIDE